ncbi:hypothetical protein [Burkholderia sp. TSV86]|uniref:hypothetical protein n=1 Tax=Burkholderia sp. TSV86 TaxID=1385594 RepID=UPI00075DD58F|nr:hypothetical protein [Burkholderia sp. TSV86]KVE39194.1 hypothetical protein WS68_20535 [Burkholderia sp. TSV86]
MVQAVSGNRRLRREALKRCIRTAGGVVIDRDFGRLANGERRRGLKKPNSVSGRAGRAFIETMPRPSRRGHRDHGSRQAGRSRDEARVLN